MDGEREQQTGRGSCLLEPATIEAGRLLGATFEQSPIGVFVLTPAGETVLYNPAMERLTGYGREDACTPGWLSRLLPVEDRDTRDWFERAVREALPAQVETRVTRKDGSTGWLAVTLQPVRIAEERVVLGLAADVSGRRRLAEERRAALESSERASRELEAIADLSALAISTLDLGELLDKVLWRVADLTRSQRALLLLLLEDRLVAVASVGLEQQVRDGFSLAWNEGFAGAVAEAQGSLYSPDVPSDPRFAYPFMREHGVRSAYGVPLLRPGGELEGVLLVGWLRYHEYDEREVRLLEIVASRLASAAFNATLYEESVRGRRLGEAQSRLVRAISSLDSEEVMRRVVEESREALGSDGAGIAILQDGAFTVRYAVGNVTALKGHRLSERASTTLIGRRPPEMILITDAYSDERVDADITRRTRIGALIGAPLISHGRYFGGLALTWEEPVRSFDPVDVDFVARVGGAVSLALENARLYEAQAGIARTLQEALLAVPERLEGVEFGHLYRSATEQAEVGGDFYDLFSIEPDLAGVVVGDVSGKGVEAATLTALVKNVVRAYAYEDDSPASVLRRTNEVIRMSSPPNVFVTMFFGRLCPDTGDLVYCSAGHPPPLVRRADGSVGAPPAGVEELTGRCPLLGALPALGYDDHRERLGKDDVLLLFTDGLIEARSPSEGFYGVERVARLFAEERGARAHDLPDRLYRDVMRFTGGHLADDLAIVTVALEG